MADDASLFASLMDRYEAADAWFLAADMRYYGLISNDVQRYLDKALAR